MRGDPEKSDSGISGFVDCIIINQKPLHEIENILIQVAEIRLCQGILTEDELPYVSKAVPKRVREFTAGRHIARRALRHMNVAASSIPVAKNRCPVWPDGIVGSISHTDDIVGVALARTQDYVSVGFDIEAGRAVKPELFNMFLTDDESYHIDPIAESELATLIFSCKESVYKAVYPLVGEFLEFRDLEISITDDGFEVSCVNDVRSNAYIGSGRGFLEVGNDLVKTLFVIQNSAASLYS